MFLLLNKDTKKTINLTEKLLKKHALTNCQPWWQSPCPYAKLLQQFEEEVLKAGVGVEVEPVGAGAVGEIETEVVGVAADAVAQGDGLPEIGGVRVLWVIPFVRPHCELAVLERQRAVDPREDVALSLVGVVVRVDDDVALVGAVYTGGILIGADEGEVGDGVAVKREVFGIVKCEALTEVEVAGDVVLRSTLRHIGVLNVKPCAVGVAAEARVGGVEPVVGAYTFGHEEVVADESVDAVVHHAGGVNIIVDGVDAHDDAPHG